MVAPRNGRTPPQHAGYHKIVEAVEWAAPRARGLEVEDFGGGIVGFRLPVEGGGGGDGEGGEVRRRAAEDGGRLNR